MTDIGSNLPTLDEQQLIALLEEKSPDELTIGEIEAMRAALPHSPELQQVLSRHIQMDHYLADALGRLSLSVDEILARAAADSNSSKSFLTSTVSFGVLFLLAGVIGFFAIGHFWGQPKSGVSVAANPQLAKANDKKKEDITSEQKKSKESEAKAGWKEKTPPTAPVEQAVIVDSETKEKSAASEAAETAEQSTQRAEQPVVSEVSRLTVAELLSRLDNPMGDHSAKQNDKHGLAETEGAANQQQDPADKFEKAPGGWPIAEQDPDIRLFPGPATVTDEQQLEKLRNWFAAVPGANYQFQVNKTEAILQGVAQISEPWRDQVVLRLELNKIVGTRIHLWHGQQGVTIYAQQPAADKTWAAATTTRKGTEAIPATYALTSTDHGRAWRTGDNGDPGPSRIDIHYEAGEVIVSRGNIKLLSAPLPGYPEEVYLEGKTHLCNVSMLRAAPLHPDQDLARTVEFELNEATNANWLTHVGPNAKLTRLDSGGASLSVGASTELQSAAIPLPPGGVREVIFEVSEFTPGMGVFVGDERGQPFAQARFFRVKNSKQEQLAVDYPPLADQTTEKSVDFNAELHGYVGQRAFIKLLASGGRVRYWISSDGQRWAQFAQPQALSSHDIRSVGLLCGPINKPGEISLHNVTVSHLSMLDALAPEEIVSRAPALTIAPVSAWLERVLESQPRDVDSDQWRTACVLRSLAAGAPIRLSGELSKRFLLERLSETPELTEKLKLIEAVTYLADTWSQGEGSLDWNWLESKFRTSGEDLLVHGNHRPYQSLLAPLISLPVWTVDNTKLPLQDLAREELLASVSAAQWKDVVRCSRRLMTYGYLGLKQENPQLALTHAWAQANAIQYGDAKQIGDEIAVLNPHWRHPLSIELSKEGFNVLAELEVAIANRAYQDACEIVSTTQGAGAFGLLPSGKDASLWSSFPLAVSEKMRRFPEMQVTMREQFGAVGLLRVKQAVVQADEDSLEMATVQFFGTPASSLAHFWLGNRALSAGDFAKAMRHFSLASPDADAELQVQIHAHRRLAAALSGEPWGTPVTQAVKLGESQMSAEQFEALVVDSLNRARSSLAENSPAPKTITGRSVQTVGLLPSPKPAQYSVVQRGRLDQIAGSLSGAAVQSAQLGKVDWPSRCFAPLVDKDFLYFTDGTAVTAWNLSSGQQLWKTQIAGPGGNSQQLGIFSLHPVLVGDVLVTRRRIQQTYGLVALEASTGKLLWQAAGQMDNALEFNAVSDPLYRNGEILSLASEVLGKEVVMSLVAHDLETGELLRKKSVGVFSQSWQQYQACSVRLYRDSVYAVMGGSVLCLAPEGEVRWVRRQAWIAPDVDLDWATQMVSPPYTHQQSMYLAPEGTQGLESLEADSGKLNWRHPAIDVQRVLGVEGEVLVVQTDSGLAALNANDGALLWEHPVEGAFDCFCAPQDGSVAYVRRVAANEKSKYHPQFVWVDLKSGKASGYSTCWDLKTDMTVFGPLFGKGDKIWALMGYGTSPTSRELLELQPQPESQALTAKQPQPGNPLNAWSTVPPVVSEAAKTIVSEWTLLNAEADFQSGLVAEHQAVKNVLALKPSAAEPVRMAKFLSIPETGKTLLHLQYAASPSGTCILLVKLGDASLWRKKTSGAETAGAWQKVDIDLTPFAGQSGWLQIQQMPSGESHNETYWAEAEIKTSP